MLKYIETKDWEKAFLDVIPQRKGVQNKNHSGSKQDSENSNSEEDTKDEEPDTSKQLAKAEEDSKDDKSKTSEHVAQAQVDADIASDIGESCK
jgi:tRNA (guanine9-N1)-methyltransferase